MTAGAAGSYHVPQASIRCTAGRLLGGLRSGRLPQGPGRRPMRSGRRMWQLQPSILRLQALQPEHWSLSPCSCSSLPLSYHNDFGSDAETRCADMRPRWDDRSAGR